MATYYLTVFSKDGEKLLDEHFDASADSEAKKIGTDKLSKKGYLEHTHRCVSPSAKLVLFHR
ncbi:YhzD family protein [Oceanobacillus jeddahense]|uniref:YhzD-like protein n=1 Tax=Oceanobacillus jeddahense TaxID=1462527 RepID=A0ABY5K1Y8_9BACI|nr:YhzD family protein [Oceanobacillus jeddahense]UUI05152.1 hypothetical protein NP439_11130 [Oceanobacillus jeddahense]